MPIRITSVLSQFSKSILHPNSLINQRLVFFMPTSSIQRKITFSHRKPEMAKIILVNNNF